MRFANGLMNESNSLVASVMEKLPEVRTTQLQMRDAAQWGALSESQRAQITERSAQQRSSVRLYYLCPCVDMFWSTRACVRIRMLGFRGSMDHDLGILGKMASPLPLVCASVLEGDCVGDVSAVPRDGLCEGLQEG